VINLFSKINENRNKVVSASWGLHIQTEDPGEVPVQIAGKGLGDAVTQKLKHFVNA